MKLSLTVFMICFSVGKDFIIKAIFSLGCLAVRF